MNLIERMIKPLLDAEYEKGYSAGVSAEKLVKDKEIADLEYSALCRGIEAGKEEFLKEMEREIEEISAREFEELTGMDKEPFGFVGTIDDLSLVLDESEENAAC